MLTRRGKGSLATAVVLWVGSRVFGIPEFTVAALAILALTLIAVIGVLVSATKLHTDRFVQPAKLAFGERGVVQLTLTNLGRRSLNRIHVTESAPAALADPPRLALPDLRSGERFTVTYPLHARQRGIGVLGPLLVERHDPFRIARRIHETPGTATVTVRPKIVPLPTGLPRGGFSEGSGEGRFQPRPGGGELAEVREYVQGDPLRTIHWPSTAHRGTLMVRREEGPQDPRSTVLLDLRRSRHHGAGPASTIETAISAAASVLVHLDRQRQGVALIDHAGAHTRGSRPVEDWLDHLAEVTGNDDDLVSMLHPLTVGTGVGSTFIAVVTPLTPHELPILVRAGRSASVRVALIIGSGEPSDHSVGTAAGLRAAGWRVAHLHAIEDLATSWNDVLRAPRPSAGRR